MHDGSLLALFYRSCVLIAVAAFVLELIFILSKFLAGRLRWKGYCVFIFRQGEVGAQPRHCFTPTRWQTTTMKAEASPQPLRSVTRQMGADINTGKA